MAHVQHLSGVPSVDVDFVVDTGADLTVLRDSVAHSLGAWDSAWRMVGIAGVGTQPEARLLYACTVALAHHEVMVEVDCRDDLDEDILGRDVINEFSLTVCAKRDKVEFEWVESA